MSKTVQIRDISEETYSLLRQRAAESGMSVPELLRREVDRMVSRPSMREWLDRTASRGWTPVTLDTVSALDELRGPWPTDAGR